MKAPLISAGALVLCLAAVPRSAQPHPTTSTAVVATASGARIDVGSAGIAPNVLQLATSRAAASDAIIVNERVAPTRSSVAEDVAVVKLPCDGYCTSMRYSMHPPPLG